jgi:hypothetical protein
MGGNLFFRIGATDISVKCTHSPNTVYGYGSRVGNYGHAILIDADFVSLKNVITHLKSFCKGLVPAVVILKSCKSDTRYHLIVPYVYEPHTAINLYTALCPNTDLKHMGMGIAMGQWVLRLTPKEDGEYPYVIGVLPLSLGDKYVLWETLVELLMAMNCAYDYNLMDKYGLVTLDDWITTTNSYCLRNKVPIDRYNTVRRFI